MKHALPISLALRGSLLPVPPESRASPPGVTSWSSVPCRPQPPWYGGWMSDAFAPIVRARPCPPLADRFVTGWPPSTTARYFSSCPSDSASRRTPCPPSYERWLQVPLGCVRLSPSCPVRVLHTFLSPA